MVQRTGYWIAIALALMVFPVGDGRAQVPAVARVVTSCGTVPTTYVAGSNNPVVQDVNGKLCTNAASSGGGAVTIADGADVAEGTTTDGACAGDATSGCTVLSRLSRIAARLTTLITAVGSPFQAGGSIGNTTFGATLPATPLIASGNGVVITPTTEAASGVAPSTAVAAAESCRVLQASAANVYKVTVAIAATTGYVMIFNATSAPSDGAVSPAWPALRVVSDGTSGWTDIPFNPPLRLGTGATVCFSSTGPFTKTASATAAIGGLVK